MSLRRLDGLPDDARPSIDGADFAEIVESHRRFHRDIYSHAERHDLDRRRYRTVIEKSREASADAIDLLLRMWVPDPDWPN
ncbi:MAG: hypothetical protein JNM89_15980 [Hyphomicrobiaceae bacterium]|nr:hypothetical protein [Hyphomicrobiaceae bacterium]